MLTADYEIKINDFIAVTLMFQNRLTTFPPSQLRTHFASMNACTIYFMKIDIVYKIA